MADAAQADAQQGGLPVRGHQMAARQQQDGDPPAEPVGGAAVDLVEGALRVAGALGDGLVELVGQDGAEAGGDHAFQRQVQGQGGADARRLVGDPFHGSSIGLGCRPGRPGAGCGQKGGRRGAPLAGAGGGRMLPGTCGWGCGRCGGIRFCLRRQAAKKRGPPAGPPRRATGASRRPPCADRSSRSGKNRRRGRSGSLPGRPGARHIRGSGVPRCRPHRSPGVRP